MRNYTLLELKKICARGCSYDCPFAEFICECKSFGTSTWNCLLGGRHGYIPKDLQIEGEEDETDTETD